MRTRRHGHHSEPCIDSALVAGRLSRRVLAGIPAWQEARRLACRPDLEIVMRCPRTSYILRRPQVSGVSISLDGWAGPKAP
jgi:hypothetical protein